MQRMKRFFTSFLIGVHFSFGVFGSATVLLDAQQHGEEAGFSTPQKFIIYPGAALAGFGAGMAAPWIYAIKKVENLVM